MRLKNSTKIVLSVVTAGILMIGCGGGSSSLSSSESTGTFVDSAVIGAHYKASSGIEGETDSQGRFKYKRGDKVTFSLGNLILGEATPANDGLITPKNIADDNQTVVLMLQLLQSLDSDGNVSNGITIDEDAISLSEEKHISDLNESELVELAPQHLDEDGDGHLDVSADNAKKHMNESVYKWKKEHNEKNGNKNGFNFDDYLPSPNLTQELKDSLAYMGNEERLAYDVYMNLYNSYQNNGTEIKQFYNISTKSESKHISIVQSLVKRYDLNATDFTNVDESIVNDNNMSASNMPSGVYDIPAIQNLYNTLYTLGQSSEENALKVGCMVEVTDINDLDGYITQADDSNATDIKAAFETLRNGSYNHYWAFDKALKNRGVTNGCYYEGDALLTNKEGIYPKNEKGQEEQKGSGNGKGNGQGNGKHKGGN